MGSFSLWGIGNNMHDLFHFLTSILFNKHAGMEFAESNSYLYFQDPQTVLEHDATDAHSNHQGIRLPRPSHRSQRLLLSGCSVVAILGGGGGEVAFHHGVGLLVWYSLILQHLF